MNLTCTTIVNTTDKQWEGGEPHVPEAAGALSSLTGKRQIRHADSLDIPHFLQLHSLLAGLVSTQVVAFFFFLRPCVSLCTNRKNLLLLQG